MTSGNLYDHFEPVFARFAQRPALISPGGETLRTFAALRDESARYGNALAALGVAAGDRVTVQTEKSVAGIALFLAVLRAGAVYQPLNPAYTEAEVDYFVGDAAPTLIVADPARQRALRQIADRHGVTAVTSLAADGSGSLAELAQRMDSAHRTAPRAPSDLAGLLYTSGTTGRSKGAMITHGNLLSNAEALVRLWRITAEDTLVHALPVFHVHGLYVALDTAFLAGATVIWHERFEARQVIDSFSRATLMMGVPTFYTRLLSDAALTREACGAMRLFISGSAPLLAETHGAFAARTGHDILERYGMTETGMISSNPYDGARIPGTVGFALPGVDVRIRGDQPGIIEVRGPNVFSGYWRNPEKTAEDFTSDGYFITGDVGTLAADGRLAIVGRAKDLIISGGFNVYPKEVEEAVDGLAGIGESAVVGVPHPDFGEGVLAVVTAAGALPPEREMLAALGARLARFKVPKRIIVVETLPRNAMGKVQKSELRRQYADIFRGPITS